MMSKISKMYFAFVKKLKEHVKISIGDLKPPKNLFVQFNGLGNWGFMWGNRVGRSGGTVVGGAQSTVS